MNAQTLITIRDRSYTGKPARPSLNASLDMDAMVHGYMVCMLWASSDDEGEPLDNHCDLDDISDKAKAECREDCEDFVKQCTSAGIDLTHIGLDKAQAEAACNPGVGWPAKRLLASQHGHDLWLTRCRHGAGFWDRGYGEVGKRLSELARGMGDRYAYIGSDAMVHVD